jgi:hypothetical protein
MPVLRSREDKIIAGVCGGFAKALGWNSTLVRILYVIVSIHVRRVSRDRLRVLRGSTRFYGVRGAGWVRAVRMREAMTMAATARGIAYSASMTPGGTAHRAP